LFFEDDFEHETQLKGLTCRSLEKKRRGMILPCVHLTLILPCVHLTLILPCVHLTLILPCVHLTLILSFYRYLENWSTLEFKS